MAPHRPGTPPAASGPLSGLGVLVTRPARQAAGLVSRLAALGASPIVFPAIVILPPLNRTPLERAHAMLASYDVAFFVSANAVEYGVPDPSRWPASLPAFAPGPGTAEALVSVGIQSVHSPPERFDSEGLLALEALRDVAGKRAIVFRGETGREVLSSSLRARGAVVDEIACYRRAPPSSGAGGLVEALEEGRVHAVTITSSEGLDNLMAAIGAKGRQLLAKVPVFVPHPRIAAHARSLHLHAIETAGSDAGLIAGLLEWAASRTRHTDT
jgi:uroporphyrinogen-III synthase